MKVIYVLDWYTSKYIKVSGISDDVVTNLKGGEKIVYSSKSGDKSVLSIGEYLGYPVNTDRSGIFEKLLIGKDQEYFDQQQEFADSVFPLFKKSFRKFFPGSRPITARFHIFSYQVYFYFYAEERYVFSDYVRQLREKVGKNIFLFQVGARDMVRLSPSSKSYLTVDGRPLHSSMNRPLPSIPMENIMLQNLDGRDVERMKGYSGKLKESMSYESELYLAESKKYPVRGSQVKSKELKISGICLSFNIMSGDVTIKTKDRGIMRLPVDQLQFKEKNSGRFSQRRDHDA